jgi:hypothetical protein
MAKFIDRNRKIKRKIKFDVVDKPQEKGDTNYRKLLGL